MFEQPCICRELMRSQELVFTKTLLPHSARSLSPLMCFHFSQQASHTFGSVLSAAGWAFKDEANVLKPAAHSSATGLNLAKLMPAFMNLLFQFLGAL